MDLLFGDANRHSDAESFRFITNRQEGTNCPGDHTGTKWRDDIPDYDDVDALMNDFYRALLVLRVTGALDGARDIHPGAKIQQHPLQDFLDNLSWLCDYKRAGATVTSIAAEKTPEGPKFWVLATQKDLRGLKKHLSWVLHQLRTLGSKDTPYAPEVENTILSASITFSHRKYKNYYQLLSRCIRRVPDALAALGRSHSSNGAELLAALKKIEDLHDKPIRLCSYAYDLRGSPSIRFLDSQAASQPKPNLWSSIRHLIGRLGSWHEASKILVNVARRFPELIPKGEIEFLEEGLPPGRPRITIEESLLETVTAIFPTHDKQCVEQAFKSAMRLRFRKGYTQKGSEQRLPRSFQPRVHVEAALLDHFECRGLEFFDDVRYIGCSKPSCYCCALYFRCHPGNILARPCHGNVWIKWCSPGASLKEATPVLDLRKDVVEQMVHCMRLDLFHRVIKGQKGETIGPDSLTGLPLSSSGCEGWEEILRSVT